LAIFSTNLSIRELIELSCPLVKLAKKELPKASSSIIVLCLSKNLLSIFIQKYAFTEPFY